MDDRVNERPATRRRRIPPPQAPLFLLMQPKPDPDATDLPVAIYESEMHMRDDTPTMLFVPVAFKLETIQAERIMMEVGGHAAAATHVL